MTRRGRGEAPKRGWYGHLALLSLTVTLLLPAVGWSAGESGDLSLDQLQPGERGYGLSVFAGSKPQRFEAEVLGVMRNVAPDTSMLLVKLSGRGLEKSGVIAGMSGSPVYFEDRLVGAVAFSWPFSEEAIAGVTPIGAMRQLQGAPRAQGAAAVAGSSVLRDAAAPAAPGSPVAAVLEGLGVPLPAPGPLTSLLAAPRSAPAERLQEEVARLRPRSGSEMWAAVGWSTAGFGFGTRELLAQSLGGMSLAGAAPRDDAPQLAPGSAVAGVLVDGDLRLAVTGTVTDRRGDEILAFGHPVFGIGDIEVPMAPAEVVTVLPSQVNSFKIANFGSVVGAFRQDRRPGVWGQVGVEAPTIPLTVRMHSTEERTFDLRLAQVPPVTPVLMAIGLLGAQEAAGRSAGNMGLDLSASFDLGDRGELTLEQSFDGDAAASQAALYLLSYGAFLLGNSWAEVDLEGIDVNVVQYPEPRNAYLVGGYAERTRLEPGEQVRLQLDLFPYRGETLRRQVQFTLPVDLPAGKYYLLVGDGLSIDAVRLAVEPAAPVSFEQALRLVRSFHSRRQLVALGLFPGPGLAVAGEVMPRLPGSVQSVWAAASSRSAVPLRLTVAQEHVEELPFPLLGAVRIDLDIVRREPVSAQSGGNGGQGEGEVGDGGAAGTREVSTGEPGRPAGGGGDTATGSGGGKERRR